MHEATITAQYVNGPYRDPATGVIKFPDWGSIKTPDGIRYSVPLNMLSLFQAGQSYLVGYTTNDKGYHTIKEVRTRAQPAPAPYSPTNGGAEKGMYTKIAVDLVMRDQWTDDEIYNMIKRGRAIAARVMAVKELEETF